MALARNSSVIAHNVSSLPVFGSFSARSRTELFFIETIVVAAIASAAKD